MARKARAPPAQPQPLPPPLPPERRTVGQLVAETIRFYQHHFFQTLPLGLSFAALTQLTVAFGHRQTEPYRASAAAGATTSRRRSSAAEWR